MNAKTNLGTAEMFPKTLIKFTARKALTVCIVVPEDSNTGAIICLVGISYL